MYLSRLEIKNFRGISALSLDFHKGINILVGENNTGKTTILDALRLCLGFGAERRELYLQAEDFHIDQGGTRAETVEFHLTFSEPGKREQGIFFEMLAISNSGAPILQFHLRFTYDGDQIRRKYWGGEKEGNEIPFEVLELFYFTHMGALRDANRDLSPNKGNRLSQLFLKLVESEKKRNEFSDSINKQYRSDNDWNDLLKNGKEKIQKHLEKLSLQNDSHQVEIDFVDNTFKRIVENLKMFVPHTNTQSIQKNDSQPEVEPIFFEISQNGLGYNNLIYIATVLGDLLERRLRKPDSYITLLVEEPEAHLHPQWQNILFGYFKNIETHGIQIFITSHSPTISAKSSIDSLIVMTKKGQDLKSTPLRNIELSGIHKNYLQRFLDVTKSQLFFAKSVLLVEGISETLLMPSFAARLGEEYNLEKNAVETVNINGVAFEPFANLFNSEVAEKRINVRCAIITDDDRDDDSNISERAQNALNLEKGMVMVFPAKSTLEYELYLENETLMKTIYGKLHPKTNLDFEGDICERAKAFVEKLKANKDKGVFAQTLAGIIEDFEIVKKTYISHEEQCVNIFSQLNDKWTPVQEKNIEKRASIFLDELKKSKHKYKFVYKLSEQIKTTGLLPAIIVPGYIKSALRWAVKGNVTDTN